jgi:NAD(P)-dependent dehydrogenase (short-subunit alcohol dehydrogenase family)
MRLRNKVAVVTGAGSGFGAATARLFAEEGAKVVVNDIDDNAGGTVADEIRRMGGEARYVHADVTAEDQVEAMMAATAEAFGGLDVLVNNAAFQMTHGSILEMPPEEIDRVFRTNVYAMFYLCQAAIPQMPPGASIINTTSIQAYAPSPALLDYAATKAALNNLTVNLAQALGPRGVRVNAVAPGPIWTPLQPATRPAEKVETFGADTPLGRAGQPSELAGAYVFLASPRDASYVSGTVLGVTGGKPVF